MKFHKKYDFDKLTEFRSFRLVINHNASQKERTTIYKCLRIPVWKILGLPIWKIKEIKDKNTGEFKTRYYLCGIPLTEVCDKYEEDNI